jgi:hypothetical protein
MKNKIKYIVVAIAVLLMAAPSYAAQQSQEELVKELANPVAALISVPIQANYDEKIGPDEDGSVWRVNVQPVVPFSLNSDWNLISRTIVPLIDQTDIPVKGEGETGIGDIVQTFFFSPARPTSGGVIWAIGPVLLLPTATDEFLGSEKWGIGPSALVLKQKDSWTYGFLTNHIESVAGESDRDDISLTMIQPFLSYATKTRTSIGLSTESTYDWEDEEWTVPITLTVSQMLKAGDQIFTVGGGVRYWAESTDNGPKDWGYRIQVTFLFPK